jgi:circadian clock protein KaiB
VRSRPKLRHKVAKALRLPPTKYILRLYVTGSTPRSAAAILNVMDFCKKHLPERCDLQIIDIFQNPAIAKAEQIVATPTLIKKAPQPVRMLVGDLSDTNRVRAGLGLPLAPA